MVFEATFGGHELINRQDAGFKVGLEMEAVGEERLLHGTVLVVAGVGGHLLVCGFEVVGELAFDVVWSLLSQSGPPTTWAWYVAP